MREIEGLRTALSTRAVIEQAKGIVMATAGCDADAAFSILAQQSQHQNRKVREVAGELVAAQDRRSSGNRWVTNTAIPAARVVSG